MKAPARASLAERVPSPSNEPSSDGGDTRRSATARALHTAGRFVDLEQSARALAGAAPVSGVAWKALGIALRMQSKDPVPALEKAAELAPTGCRSAQPTSASRYWRAVGSQEALRPLPARTRTQARLRRGAQRAWQRAARPRTGRDGRDLLPQRHRHPARLRRRAQQSG